MYCERQTTCLYVLCATAGLQTKEISFLLLHSVFFFRIIFFGMVPLGGAGGWGGGSSSSVERDNSDQGRIFVSDGLVTENLTSWVFLCKEGRVCACDCLLIDAGDYRYVETHNVWASFHITML